MPALGMAQETGTLLQWLKAPGQSVTQGEPLMEVETDKATVEIEAPASGVLAQVTAGPGDVVPVGHVIAVIFAPGEAPQAGAPPVEASPVAARLAAEHRLDLAQVKPEGGRVRKEDVLAYLAAQPRPLPEGRVLASPKARRLARERGIDLRSLRGSGPDGAVLAGDLPEPAPASVPVPAASAPAPAPQPAQPDTLAVSRMWQVMAERVTQAWTSIPHFYLIREAHAAQLVAWREEAQQRVSEKLSYTDFLVKLVAAALRGHPRLNAAYRDGSILLNSDINVGLAVAVEAGLVVPVIHRADQLGLGQIAARRAEIVARAQAGKLSPDDLAGGTFTISNLGMHGVDAFNAIVNPPQAAILAVGRLAERVVPVEGRPAVASMITFSLSCDHRVVDGARGAQFLQTMAELVEQPMRLLD
jgi:pyruvate dehydrogenase E2 component (dihydrolipoamide acetyltransferase)